MIADPPALIMAARSGMCFLDFYWFQGRVGLGGISIFGVVAAMLVLLYKFRNMKNSVEAGEQEAVAKRSYMPIVVFVVSVFVIIAAVEKVGLLRDFADWMARTGLRVRRSILRSLSGSLCCCPPS